MDDPRCINILKDTQLNLAPLHTRVLRLPSVVAFVGLSRSSIYVMMKENEFPRPIQLGKRAVAWRETDIQNWLADRTEVGT